MDSPQNEEVMPQEIENVDEKNETDISAPDNDQHLPGPVVLIPTAIANEITFSSEDNYTIDNSKESQQKNPPILTEQNLANMVRKYPHALFVQMSEPPHQENQQKSYYPWNTETPQERKEESSYDISSGSYGALLGSADPLSELVTPIFCHYLPSGLKEITSDYVKQLRTKFYSETKKVRNLVGMTYILKTQLADVLAEKQDLEQYHYQVVNDLKKECFKKEMQIGAGFEGVDNRVTDMILKQQTLEYNYKEKCTQLKSLEIKFREATEKQEMELKAKNDRITELERRLEQRCAVKRTIQCTQFERRVAFKTVGVEVCSTESNEKELDKEVRKIMTLSH